MRRFLLAAVLMATPVLVSAQTAPQEGTPVSVQVLQNTIGQMAGQNALLLQRVQELTNENASLQQKLAAAEKKEAPKAEIKLTPKKPEHKK